MDGLHAHLAGTALVFEVVNDIGKRSAARWREHFGLLDNNGHVLVTSYALERPKGQWSLVKIVFHNAETNCGDSFSGPVTMITFGKAQYLWHPDRKKGHADLNSPPVKSTLTGGENTMYNLAAASLTIVCGKR